MPLIDLACIGFCSLVGMLAGRLLQRGFSWLVRCRLTVFTGLSAVKPRCPGSLPELDVWLTISPRLENVQMPGNIETIDIPAANQNKRTDVD